MKIFNNKSIKEYSYIKVGGIVKKIIFAYNEKELLNAYYKYPNCLIFGNTSKTLFAFDYLDREIIFDRNKYIIDLKDKVLIGSGTPLNQIGNYFFQHNLSGFSQIMTIPGLLGGSICQNASCLKQNISDNLIDVTFYEDNMIKTLKKEELIFSYRSSYFKFHKTLILHASFKKIFKEKQYLRQEYEESLIKRKTQPLNEINLGSIFKNKKNFQVAKILDELNLKGFSLSKDVSISQKHPNFLNIKKDCSYKQILLLINTIFVILYKQKGIIFPLEIIIIKG